METCTIFIERNTKYLKFFKIISKSIYRFNVWLGQTQQAGSKFTWKCRGPKTADTLEQGQNGRTLSTRVKN